MSIRWAGGEGDHGWRLGAPVEDWEPKYPGRGLELGCAPRLLAGNIHPLK